MGIEHFIPTIRFELNQRKNIQRIADEILKVLKHYWDSPFEIPNILNQIANSPLFKKFTDSIAKKLLSDTIIFNNVASSKSFADNMTAVNNRRKFFEQQYYSKSLRIFRNLKNDDVLQEFINNKIDEKSDLFKTIPKDLAETVVPLINKWNVQGLTSKQMSKEKLQGQISDLLDWQVRRIARTETSKTSVDIIEFKAKKCNVPCYIWRASGGGKGDGRTRKSHRGMADVIVFWNDPPAPEDLFPIIGENGKKYKNTLGNYHAGCCPNCRCVPSPLIFKDDLKFPVKVYTNGKIVSMNKGEFDSLYNSKTQQMKEEQKREKEKVEQKKENVVSGNSELESKADRLHSKLKEISLKIEAIGKQNTNTSDVNEIERLQKEVQGYIQQLNTIETELKQIQKEITVDSKFVKDYKNPIDFINQIKTDIYFCQEMEEILTNIGTALANYFNYDKIEQKEKDSQNKTKINNISYKYLPFDVIKVADDYINELSKDFPYLVSQIDNYGSFNDELRNIRENYITTLPQGLTQKEIKEKVIKKYPKNYPENGALLVLSKKNLYIKPREFLNKSLKKWENERKEKIKNKNQHPKNCYTLKSALDHEFAHIVYYFLNEQQLEHIKQIINSNKTDIEKELGKYANDSYKKGNYNEVIAEIWAKYRNNDLEEGWIKSIGEYLKEKIEELEKANK